MFGYDKTRKGLESNRMTESCIHEWNNRSSHEVHKFVKFSTKFLYFVKIKVYLGNYQLHDEKFLENTQIYTNLVWNVYIYVHRYLQPEWGHHFLNTDLHLHVCICSKSNHIQGTSSNNLDLLIIHQKLKILSQIYIRVYPVPLDSRIIWCRFPMMA